MKMNTVQEFYDQLVKIELQENGEYGYCPFHGFSLGRDGKTTLMCLAGGLRSEHCYLAARKMLLSGCKRLFMALDFPPTGDIVLDFVAVFTVEDGVASLYAVPYSTKTGISYPEITDARVLGEILDQFKAIALRPRRPLPVSLN